MHNSMLYFIDLFVFIEVKIARGKNNILWTMLNDVLISKIVDKKLKKKCYQLLSLQYTIVFKTSIIDVYSLPLYIINLQ